MGSSSKPCVSNVAATVIFQSCELSLQFVLFLDRNNQRLAKFTDDYLKLYKLTNNVTTVDSPRIILNSNFPWILEPDTDFVSLSTKIDLVMKILLTYETY